MRLFFCCHCCSIYSLVLSLSRCASVYRPLFRLMHGLFFSQYSHFLSQLGWRPFDFKQKCTKSTDRNCRGIKMTQAVRMFNFMSLYVVNCLTQKPSTDDKVVWRKYSQIEKHMYTLYIDIYRHRGEIDIVSYMIDRYIHTRTNSRSIDTVVTISG